MATRKKRAAPARPRKPRSARARPQARKKTRGHHHPELWGLGLLAIGLVLATVLWLGWDGGPVGSSLGDWLRDGVGAAAPARPARARRRRWSHARAELARRPPTVQGRPHGRDRRPHGRPRREPRRRARRCHRREPWERDRGCRVAHRRRCARPRGDVARHGGVGRSRAAPLGPRGSPGGDRSPPLDREPGVGRLERLGVGSRRAPAGRISTQGAAARRRRGVPGRRRRRPVLGRAAAAPPTGAGRDHGGQTRRSSTRPRPAPSTACRTGRCSMRARPRAATPQTSARGPRRCSSRRSRTSASRRRSSGRSPARASCATSSSSPRARRSRRSPGSGRPVVRARDDGDPHPRADPGQAGRRRRGPEPRAAHGDARRHLRRPPGHREPALGLARQGHLGERGLDRPCTHAARAHRRHDGLGKVGLHQHAPHLDPAARDPRRRAHDPHRPEADRARTSTSRSRIS